MKILAVTGSYFPELQFGGPPLRIHTLNRGLAACGCNVKVVTYHSAHAYGERVITFDDIPVQYLHWIGYRNLQIPLSVAPLLRMVAEADVVHIYGLYTLLGPPAAWYARRLGKPYLLEPMGMYLPRARRQQFKRLYHQLFTAWMARHAAKIVASSIVEAGELETLGRGEQVVVRGHLFDLAPFATLPSGTGFRDQHGVAPDETLFVFIGRISPIKNLEMLICAFHSLGSVKARLLLIGPQLEQAYVDRLNRLITQLDLTQRVGFIGPLYRTEKLAALAAADVFVLPSLAESFGNAAAEAVAANVPVLLTTTCGIASMIDGRAGLAVALDEHALREGLRTMMNVDLRSQLTHARDEVYEELRTDVPLQQMTQIYQEVATLASPPCNR